jgi:hypothetical protein
MLDADAIYREIMKAAEEWAKADEDARSLKEMDKIVLAEITNQAVGDSFADRKMKALASPEYRLHKTKMVAAKTAANIALARYKAAQALAELRRSQESTRRAEMGMR